MKNENLWHELRASNIGGSEVASLFNVSPYLSRLALWQQKKGLIPPADFGNNERVEAGNMLEGAIIDWANKRWGTAFVQPMQYHLHPTIKGMACTPDGIDANDAGIICQVKNVDGIVFGRKWTSFEDEITEAPLHIALQCQHEMACTGARENHLIVLVGGNALKRIIIKRDDDAIRMIEGAVTAFWSSIEMNEAPQPDPTMDAGLISSARAAIKTEAVADLSGDNELMDAVVRYHEAASEIKDLEAIKEDAKSVIMLKMMELKKAAVKGFSLSIVTMAETPDKTITPDMVGQVIKGRKASAYPRITKTEKE